MTDVSAIVGAGFPRPMGWETQPLRIPLPVFPVFFSRITHHGLYTCRPAINMSPLWGFKIFAYRVFYKHVAPLGLNTSPFLASPSSPSSFLWGFKTFVYPARL